MIMKFNLSILIFWMNVFFTLPLAWAAPDKIILCIGDGMGFEHVRAAGIYANGNEGTLRFELFPHKAQVSTYSENSSITDSAAAATAMATGVKVNNGEISMKGNYELTTLLEHFKDQGKKTGLVSTTYISHATPAAFGAHESNRDNNNEIVSDYLYQTIPNVLFGGAQFMNSKRAQNAGYTVVTSERQMQAIDTSIETNVSGQFGPDHMPYEYDYFSGIDNGYITLPHLSEMTATAVDILDNDSDGFFLVVEGGRIDHAAHSNEIERDIFETLEFESAVQVILEWAKGQSDTLILVTADHETGGLTVTQNNGQGVFPTVSWSTTGHTNADVPVYAVGENAQMVGSEMDNTEFFGIVTATTDDRVDYFCDTDHDGYVSSSISGTCDGTGCGPVDCQTSVGNDCDDKDETVKPHAAEDCTDGVDNDCDNLLDDVDPDAVNCSLTCAGNNDDNDVDGIDLFIQISGGAAVNLKDFAGNFGRIDCTPKT